MARTSWDGTDTLAAAALQWLGMPIAGAVHQVTYHRGDLAIDAPTRPDQHGSAALLVRICADRMQRAAQMGIVMLLQRRHGDHDYEYIARRTP